MNQAVNRALLAVRDLYPTGVSLLWKAPLVVAIAALPEFAQHVVEIQLGMFDGGDATRAAAQASIRWSFGYAKIAGLVLAMIAAARFWWTRRAGRAWYDPRGIAWGRFAFGAMLFLAVPSLPLLAKGYWTDTTVSAVGAVLSVALLPTMFLMLAGLFGDRATPVGDFWKRSWGWALFTFVLMGIAFWPASQLHRLNHVWAMRSSPAALWSLMTFDALIVGLIAVLTGTAMYLGYATFARGRVAE